MENMQTDTNISGNIAPQATPHMVDVNVPFETLNKAFNTHWDQVKDRLNPDLIKKAMKGGYRKLTQERVVKAAGGPNVFFHDVLVRLVADFMKTQDKQALAYEKVVIVDMSDPVLIQATTYMEPSITWHTTPGINEPLKVYIPKIPANLLDLTVEEELKRAQKTYAILIPVEDGVVEPGHVALVDCNSVIDGNVWDAGTFTNNKWPMDPKVFKVPELYNLLLGMRAGQSKTTTLTLGEAFGELNGKQSVVTIEVNQIYRTEEPAIDNDLAISAGKQDLASWKTELYNKYTKVLHEEKDKLITSRITAKLVNPEVVSIDPIPNAWMLTKAKQIYEDNRNLVRTEEELLARFSNAQLLNGTAVQTKNDLLTYFAEKSAEALITDLIFRSWGKMKGIQGDTSVGNVGQYADMVRKELLNLVEIIEVDSNANV